MRRIYHLAWAAVVSFSSTCGYAAPAKIVAVDLRYMNRSVSPCDDFYTYANGGYDKTPIPGDYASYGVNDEIDERTNTLLRQIVEAAGTANARTATPLQRIGDFYASGMDEKSIEREGDQPLRPILQEIDDLHTPADILREIARLQSQGFNVGFDFSVSIDDKNSSRVVARLSQGGMGLPEREYYLRPDPESAKLREDYQNHIARTLTLDGESQTASRAAASQVMHLETALAKAARTLLDLQDPEKNYHAMSRAELGQLAPQVAWPIYFSRIGFPDTERDFVVAQPEFLAAFGRLLKEEPVSTWQAYLRWQVLHHCSPALSKAFVDEHFAFYGHILSGVKELKPRWKRILASTDSALGEDLGQLYVAKAFSPRAKARALEMVQYHLKAMRERIAAADWLGEATKEQAFRKIDRMRVKVGYPDVWRDYSRLKIGRGPFVLNMLAAGQFEFERELAKLGRPVDRNEWQMSPSTNNAYYEPTLNEMCFPAGILQPPFFDEKADDASNYGALASTMGHELTHGFDNVGRQYDADGNLKNWWTEEDIKRFEARAETIATLYDKYEVLPGLYINGHQSLTENIADVGGLRVSYEAYKLAVRGKKQATVEGRTPDQRFFIAFAQAWRTNQRAEQIRLGVQSDTHSPAHWRVLGPVANFPEFRAAFGCGEHTVGGPRIW